MVTAKSLQMLDTLGNNISPAVNIETVYYEKEESGIIYRNHLFKHFPVYVKYSGHPVIQSVGGDNYQADLIYQSVFDYQRSLNNYAGLENYIIPDVDYDAFNWDFAVSEAELKENKGSGVYSDILVSGMVQSQLTGTDFYKLDVSTYNLTKILSNYATKEQVRLKNELQDAEIKNADKYQSLAYLQKKRSALTVIDPIGGIEAGVDVSTLCGQTYSHIIDQIITPIKNPSVSQARIKITVPRYIHLEKTDINNINSSAINSKYGVEFNYTLDWIEFPKWETFKMGSESLEQPKNVIQNIIIKPAGQHERVYSTNLTKPVTFTNVNASVPLNIASNTLNSVTLGSIFFSYPNKDDMEELYNSIGNPVNVDNIISYLRMCGKKVSISIKRDNNVEPIVNQQVFPDADDKINLTAVFETTFPILHGPSMSKLATTRISGLKYHQIYAKIDPSKNYYVCVPKILSTQLFNPLPYLYKILQQSKWQAANNWSITNIKNSYPGFEGFIVYTIAKQGIGMSKEVKFVINMTPSNVNAIRMAKTKN